MKITFLGGLPLFVRLGRICVTQRICWSKPNASEWPFVSPMQLSNSKTFIDLWPFWRLYKPCSSKANWQFVTSCSDLRRMLRSSAWRPGGLLRTNLEAFYVVKMCGCLYPLGIAPKAPAVATALAFATELFCRVLFCRLPPAERLS